MARIRSIHPDACKSEKLSAASAEAERCYWRLMPHCDDEGRAEDDPRNLRSLMFSVAEPPIPAVTVDEWLAELSSLGLVIRYKAEDCRYLQVTRWGDYQRPQKATRSAIPPPPGYSCTAREESRSGRVSLSLGEGVGEGGGEGARECPDPFPITDALKSWALEHEITVNLTREAEKMANWAQAKGTKRKSWDATFRNWCLKAQEDAGSRNGTQQRKRTWMDQ